MIDAPEPWEHNRGYHLRGNGQFIEYEHPRDLYARIQVDDSEFMVMVSDPDGTREYERIKEKSEAIECLEMFMEDYS